MSHEVMSHLEEVSKLLLIKFRKKIEFNISSQFCFASDAIYLGCSQHFSAAAAALSVLCLLTFLNVFTAYSAPYSQ